MLILQCRRISTYGSGRVVFIRRNLDPSGIAFNSTHDFFNKRHEVSPRQEMRTIEVIECPPTVTMLLEAKIASPNIFLKNEPPQTLTLKLKMVVYA